jgi:hypothetical protein
MSAKTYNTKLIVALLIIIAGLCVVIYLKDSKHDEEIRKEKLMQAAARVKISQLYNMIDEAQEENTYLVSKQADYKKEIDSLKKIKHEIPNPELDPIPNNDARNDSIRKWAREFLRRNP